MLAGHCRSRHFLFALFVAVAEFDFSRDGIFMDDQD